ncbi:uncharacterized protein BJX67DRAFT_366791 [Aspergillus lucknowensis]|uniref:Zn(2)-C6 fungal-type domain-containing protein n=1 Tax=Aspergillus lucknowensis TaxID=176173 RepID=A0ABR4LFK6_9EURO
MPVGSGTDRDTHHALLTESRDSSSAKPRLSLSSLRLQTNTDDCFTPHRESRLVCIMLRRRQYSSCDPCRRSKRLCSQPSHTDGGSCTNCQRLGHLCTLEEIRAGRLKLFLACGLARTTRSPSTPPVT